MSAFLLLPRYRADIHTHYGRSHDDCMNPVFFQGGLIVQETCLMTKTRSGCTRLTHTGSNMCQPAHSHLPHVQMKRCNSAAARGINGNTNRGGGGLSHTGAFMKDHFIGVAKLLDADMLTRETHH